METRLRCIALGQNPDYVHQYYCNISQLQFFPLHRHCYIVMVFYSTVQNLFLTLLCILGTRRLFVSNARVRMAHQPSLFVKMTLPSASKSLPTFHIHHHSLRTCFLAGCVHKFRSAFGKANIVRNGEAVTLAFSGGTSSTAMLNLAKMVSILCLLLNPPPLKCQAVTEPRKLRFHPTVLCVYGAFIQEAG